MVKNTINTRTSAPVRQKAIRIPARRISLLGIDEEDEEDQAIEPSEENRTGSNKATSLNYDYGHINCTTKKLLDPQLLKYMNNLRSR